MLGDRDGAGENSCVDQEFVELRGKFDGDRFVKRLELVVGSESLNSFATRAGMREGSLRQYQKGSLPKIDKAAAIAAAGDVSLGWLVAGEVQTARDAELSIRLAESRLQEVDEDHSPEGIRLASALRKSIIATGEFRDSLIAEAASGGQSQSMIMGTGGLPAGFATVPMIAVRPSAGPGSLALYQEEDADFYGIRETFLRRLGMSPSYARLMIAKGDSMSETVNDGDLMIVDVSIREIVDEGIYVLVYGGLVILKRIQLLRKGGIVLKSDNPRYAPEEVPAHEMLDIKVEARVKWVGGAI